VTHIGQEEEFADPIKRADIGEYNGQNNLVESAPGEYREIDFT